MRDNPFSNAPNARRQAREAAEREAERKRAEQYERKLIREIEAEEEQRARAALADPPPELSPQERLARENAERLDRIEGKEQEKRLGDQGGVGLRQQLESSDQHRRKEALRLLRTKKDNEAQAKRNAEHEKRCAKHIERLERAIADTEESTRAERARHRQAMDKLNAEYKDLTERLGALLRPLPARHIRATG